MSDVKERIKRVQRQLLYKFGTWVCRTSEKTWQWGMKLRRDQIPTTDAVPKLRYVPTKRGAARSRRG